MEGRKKRTCDKRNVLQHTYLNCRTYRNITEKNISVSTIQSNFKVHHVCVPIDFTQSNRKFNISLFRLNRLSKIGKYLMSLISKCHSYFIKLGKLNKRTYPNKSIPSGKKQLNKYPQLYVYQGLQSMDFILHVYPI